MIYHRANAKKGFMELMTFSGEQPTLREAKIAKNYLDEKELRSMRQLVSGYLDFAERQAEREVPMTMKDWAKHLDGILTSTGENLLTGNGAGSHLQAMEKAQTDYKKYKAKTLSSVEKDYLDSIKLFGNSEQLKPNRRDTNLQERGFTEKDWKLFKSKIPDWQEAYMDKLNIEYVKLLNKDMNPSEKFWQLEKRIKEDRKRTGVQLEMSRSNLIFNIISLINDGAISIEDLREFSDELQETVKHILNDYGNK